MFLRRERLGCNLVSRGLSRLLFYKNNLLVSLMRERLGCGLVSRGLSRLLFYQKKKMIGVFNAGEAWQWLGLPRSLLSSFFVKNN